MADSQQKPDEPRRPKSLWEVMSHGQYSEAPRAAEPTPAGTSAERSSAEHPAETPEEPQPPLASLWKLMGSRPPTIPDEQATKETAATPLKGDDTASLDTMDDIEPTPPRRSETVSRPPKRVPRRHPRPNDAAPVIEIRKPPRETTPPRSSGKARASIWISLIAVALSGLALLPGMWSKFPALGVGFISLFLGFLAADEIRTSRGRVLGINQAITGMSLSIAAMFLGPLLAWATGSLGLFHSDQRVTTSRLESVGAAINDYRDRHGQFPAGGTFFVKPGQPPQPMHGWMTSLLPFLGYEQLHQSINLSLPYDDPENIGAMRRQIPEFLVAGVKQTTSINKFGAAHFAGVGGEEQTAEGRIVHFGVFDRNSTVFDQDIPDGLSNTFIAGELPGSYPAWGEPENWRHITKGLNRDQRGFGSASGGPVLFLMADGSVKGLSPDTDLRTLRSMSTRDGGD